MVGATAVALLIRPETTTLTQSLPLSGRPEPPGRGGIHQYIFLISTRQKNTNLHIFVHTLRVFRYIAARLADAWRAAAAAAAEKTT